MTAAVTAVVTPAGDAAPAAAALQPRQLVVTLYGLYARERGGWLSVAALVRLMAALGVDEPAVRSTVSRLKRRGLLDARREGDVAGYALTDLAREVLADGDARIFGRRRAGPDDGWLLVVFSVPESERERRHQLRSELTRLGFGTVAPGVWIAPAHLTEEAEEVLRRRGLTGYVESFTRARVPGGAALESVARWWDLDALHERYAGFLERHADAAAGRGRPEPARAFADYVRLLTDWRALPYADPGLPLELLPADWNGLLAADSFARLQERLAGPAAEEAARLVAG